MLAGIFKSVLLMSAAGGILSVLLLCLMPVTRKVFSPRWQYYIWLTVLIVLLLPVRFTLPEITSDIQPTGQTRDVAVNSAAANQETALQAETSGTSQPEPLSGERQAVEQLQISLPQNAIRTMSILWLAGAIAALLVKILKYIVFLRAIKKHSYRDDCISDLPKGLCLRRTDLLDAPLIAGLFKPVLYLPDMELSRDSLYYILLHEMIHYKRHDLLYKWLTMVVLCVHWFNPLIYAVSWQIDSDCEASCDAAATYDLSEQEKNSYMNMILDMLMRSRSNPRPLTTQMASEKKIIKRRFEMMRSGKKTSKFTAAISVIVAVALLTATMFASGVLSALALGNTEIDVTNNGEKIELANEPFIENSTVYLPLRELLNLEGVTDISYNDGYAKFLIYSETPVEYRGLEYNFRINRVLIGSEYAYIAGHSEGTTENTELFSAPILKDNTTYVPVDLFDKLKMSGQGVFENFVVSVKDNTALAGALYRNDDMNFKVALPLSWMGKYQIIENETFVYFVQSATYDKYGAGTLCTIDLTSPDAAEELVDIIGGKLLYSDADGAYVYGTPTDVQYPIWPDHDEEDVTIASEYEEMFQQVDFIRNSFDLLVRTPAYYDNAENLSFDDMNALQSEVDNGHYPWRLDPAQTVREYAQSNRRGDGEVTDLTETGVWATASYTVGGRVYRVELIRPVRQDGTGAWVVKSFA